MFSMFIIRFFAQVLQIDGYTVGISHSADLLSFNDKQ